MKTEDIKTWQERLCSGDRRLPSQIVQSEIDELRAALKERDAEIARAHTNSAIGSRQIEQLFTYQQAQRAVMQQALDALEIVEWNGGTQQWVKKTGSEAIDALKEALK